MELLQRHRRVWFLIALFVFPALPARPLCAQPGWAPANFIPPPPFTSPDQCGWYYLGAALFYRGRSSSCVARSRRIYSPYAHWQETVPCGGAGDYFRDKTGRWWCTYFGNDTQAPWREKPGIIRIIFSKYGRILVSHNQSFVNTPLWHTPNRANGRAGALAAPEDRRDLRRIFSHKIDCFTLPESGQRLMAGRLAYRLYTFTYF